MISVALIMSWLLLTEAAGWSISVTAALLRISHSVEFTQSGAKNKKLDVHISV